jgi:hypothetical protein
LIQRQHHQRQPKDPSVGFLNKKAGGRRVQTLSTDIKHDAAQKTMGFAPTTRGFRNCILSGTKITHGDRMAPVRILVDG